MLVNDGRGQHDPLHLIVEIKGYRREDAKDKKSTMENYWVPGINRHGGYGRWSFAEFRDVFEMGSDLAAAIQARFDQMIHAASGDAGAIAAEQQTADG